MALILAHLTINTNGQQLHIGQVERVYELPPEVANVVGVAFRGDESGDFSYAFEGASRKIYQLKVDEVTRDLSYENSFLIEGADLSSPKGLTYKREVSGDVFYFLDFVLFQENGIYKKKGILYRYDLTNRDLTSIDLSDTGYEIGTSPVHAVSRQAGYLYVSYDPSSFGSYTARVRRGLMVLSVDDGESVSITRNSKTIKRPRAWQEALDGHPMIVQQMPGPGKETADGGVEASHSLTAMTIDSNDYLWGTVGNDYIYLMESKTGRGIFFFDRPGSKTFPFYDMMAYGDGNLWVAEKSTGGTFFIHRVNILSNLMMSSTGQKRFREMKMLLTSTVSSNVSSPRGYVYHTFCHPYSSDITGNQGVVPNSVRVNDLTGLSDYTVEELYLDPADDPATRQHYTLVSYLTDQNPDVRQYKTELFIKYWTRDYRNFIYPHLAFRDGGPVGTHYLDDDEVLYGISSDPESYEGFIFRVRESMAEEYNIEPDMENPYWASLNILEYIVENYHYPNDNAGYYATYDFAGNDYNSHPGNLKAAYSADDSYVDNITACSGSGAMVGGVLRYIGLPSLWLGTSKQIALTDEFFESENNEAQVSNGHRYNKVWLGSFYGWQDIDATPRVPKGNAFSSKPKEMSQWEIMQKAFARVTPQRLVHNLQSEFWDKLHVPFRYVCETRVNTCGSTRYNLLGSYTNPELFNLSSQVMTISGIQFLKIVNVELDSDNNAAVTWQKSGEWDNDPGATLTLVLEKQ
ncbi:MAG: hypothetical protein IH591_16930, partial [Bacteroidales bacterium]|nr:hypothetical protein [Bacteroidales bacterium]